MLIQMIPEDYIINAPAQCLWTYQSDFVIKAIRILNDAAVEIHLKRITFEITAEGKMIKEVGYEGEALEQLIREFPDKVMWMDDWASKVHMGQSDFYKKEQIATTLTLQPGTEIGIKNEFFLVVYPKPVDELILSVSYLQKGQLSTEELRIPVIEYRTNNDYHFPVKGIWQVCGNYDCIGAHRGTYSMKFAFDLGKINLNTDFIYKKDRVEEDYLALGEDILAIADGEVVACFNDSELRVGFPEENMDEEQLVYKENLIRNFGYLPFQCGNHVVLKHDGGEYSLYGHMLYHSQTVKIGDFVKQGQPIGKIGNTGKSGCPHLHFQLMKGPDYSTARGLPCHFTNIADVCGNTLDLIREEYTIVSTNA